MHTPSNLPMKDQQLLLQGKNINKVARKIANKQIYMPTYDLPTDELCNWLYLVLSHIRSQLMAVHDLHYYLYYFDLFVACHQIQ